MNHSTKGTPTHMHFAKHNQERLKANALLSIKRPYKPKAKATIQARALSLWLKIAISIIRLNLFFSGSGAAIVFH